MKPRPTIFLSGVSHEFASFRDAVEIEIQKKGCFAENQPSFATDYRTIEAMLRQKLSEADAVIHIVGFRYGAEPHARPETARRRSYTQMEFDIARELDKPVYCFLSADASVRDAPTGTELPEPDELAALQAAHRATVNSTNNIRYSFRDKQELCSQVAAIQIIASGFDFRVDVSRIDQYAPEELIGRETELTLLDGALLKVQRAESPRARILTFVALGGEGKTSLIAKWVAQLAHHNWPGCDTVFAWSFYSQGTREQFAGSSDLFLKEAITFFGNDADKEFAASSAGAYEKGQRLARIVGERRALLILDGLEPLQYAPTLPTPGELKDAGILALVKSLAANSEGLCIVTTRYSLPNLKAFRQTTAPEIELLRLSREAGVHLLKSLGVKGSSLRNIFFNDGKEHVNEFEKLVEDVKGHALTLNLLGTYLRDAHGGDIRRRDLINLEEADAEEQAGHSFRVMEAYEQAFESEGEKGQRAVATLRLLGLFDRPATADCLRKLLEDPPIPNLTEPLTTLTEAQWNIVLKRLEDANLLTVNRDSSSELVSLDAHPLLREYFAHRLRKQNSDAWRAAHRRLYEHLCATTPYMSQPTLEMLQPLFQAVRHGCQGEVMQAACELYHDRIEQGQKHYTTRRLGAFGSDLGTVACFFETPWSRLLSGLSQATQSWLLSDAAFNLRALGRLTEALEPLRVALQMSVEQKDWNGAAIRANNLSELELTLGNIREAVRDAEQSVMYADHCHDGWRRIGCHVAVANAKHQCGRREEVYIRFSEAENLFKSETNSDWRVGTWGFFYCEFILAPAECAAWKRINDPTSNSSVPELENVCREVKQQTGKMLEWVTKTNAANFEIALVHLMIGRLALCEAILASGNSETQMNQGESPFAPILTETDVVVSTMRRAGTSHWLPTALLSRALLRFLVGERSGPDSAQEDLDEAWEIAERGPMRLYMADIHLYRARLFFREKEYPWESARADLEAAERLINDCGYHRRDEELADAKRAILGA